MVAPALLTDVTPFGNAHDVARFAATPIQERLRAHSTYDLVVNAARRWPGQTAIRFLPLGLASDKPRDLTFAALATLVTRTANLFHAMGVSRNDAVAILLPTLPETFVTLWGAAAAGVACAINPLLAPAHIAEILRTVRAKIVVSVGPDISPEIFETARAAAALIGARLAIVAGSAPDGAVAAHELRLEQPAGRLIGSAPTLDDVASIFHTGGTTARPKLVAHTHRNHLVCAIQSSAGCDLRPAETLLSALPANHVIAGIATGLVMLTTGARLLVPGAAGFRNPYLLQDFWKIVAQHRVAGFSAVPTVLVALSGVPVKDDISCLKYVSCGASPMPRDLIAAFEAKTGARVIESYGMTEATTIVSTNPRAGERPAGSVGLPAPYVDVRIVGQGASAPASAGQAGVVQIRGPAVVSGYVGEAPVVDQDGWFDTGDLGSLDAAGFLYLSGRTKDLIIRSGHNIDPRLIEEALHAHPAVALAAAVGRPDAYAGEVPIAFVTLRPGESATPDELEAYARGAVSERPAAPAEIVILAEMPLTPIGKIFKPALRARARGRAVELEVSRLIQGPFQMRTNDIDEPVIVACSRADAAVIDAALAGLAARLGVQICLEIAEPGAPG